MKQEAQAAIAIPLRAAVWNWIDLYPEEFNDTMRNHRRLEGAPERVFDILYELHESQHKANVWPTLTALVCISSERMRAEFSLNSLGVPRANPGRRVCSVAQDNTFESHVSIFRIGILLNL